MTPFEVFWDSLDQPIRLGNQVLAFSISQIVFELVVPLIIIFALFFFGFRWIKSYIKKTSLGEERKAAVISGFRLGIQVLFAIIALILVSRFLEDRILQMIDDVFKFIRNPFYKSGGTEISVLTLILALPVFWLSYLIGKAARMAFERSHIISTNIPEARRRSIANLIRYGIMSLALVIGLSIIGIDLSAIGIILAIVAIAVVIGLHQVLASFFSGLIIILNRPFKEGDFVRVYSGGVHHEGIIKQISMLNTAVLTIQNETIYVPNAHLLNNAVFNLSLPEENYLAHVTVCVDYESEIDKIQPLLEGVARNCPFWSGIGDPSVKIKSFAPQGIELVVMLQLVAAADKANATLWLNQQIWQEFKTRRIRFAAAR